MQTTTSSPTRSKALHAAPDARVDPWLQWRREATADTSLSVAELAECSCPDLCNRDHANE